MGKRVADLQVDDYASSHKAKKAKLQAPSTAEEIFSARQLQTILVFRQDAVQQLRSGIQSFKAFLEAILYVKDEQNRDSHIAILADFLDISTPKSSEDRDAVILSDLFQAWDFASQTNNDYLASSVSSILALLLKTLSSLIDLRIHGIVLGKSLLKHNQLRLLSRSLAAPKHKEHVISPCLRILIEVVSFDGGVLAKQLYSRRESTFDANILARNLGMLNLAQEEDRRKPSVRSNAVRYLLANLRHQTEGAKIDILKNSNLLRALFGHLKDDTPELVRDILRTIETCVLRDEALPRATKSYTLSERTLFSILNVARASANDSLEQPGPVEGATQPLQISRKDEALRFLRLVCTTSTLGILRASSWYPPGSDRQAEEDVDDNQPDTELDLGLESSDWFNRYATHVPIRNPILAGLLQTLRPHASPEERKLALEILDAAPELVADYYFKRADNLLLDPKLTNTWIGHVSFLFSVSNLPLPRYFGVPEGYASRPPPSSIVTENIIPGPLTQKVLTRCLNQSSNIITLFAIRIIVVALEKLERVLAIYHATSHNQSDLWTVGASELRSSIGQRLPPIKDVIMVFRQTSGQDFIQREAVTRLLRLYYVVVPEHATDEGFDVSTALLTALESVQSDGSDQESRHLQALELQHLVAVAQRSAGMRWWHKQGSLSHSPFVTLLRLCASASVESALESELTRLVESVVNDFGLLQQDVGSPATYALVASLVPTKSWSASEQTLGFLEECVGRLVRKPVKYQDDLDTLRAKTEIATGPLSLLVVACVEQLPFTSRLGKKEQENVLMWILRFCGMLELVGEDKGLLRSVASTVEEQNPRLEKHSRTKLKEHLSAVQDQQRSIAHVEEAKPGAATNSENIPGFEILEPLAEKDTYPELHRWQTKDAEEAIESGDVSELIMCLCSQHVDIRLQALASLRKLMLQIHVSTYEEKDQVYLLLAELVESAKDTIGGHSLPTVAGAFATHALKVLADPSHWMYPKVNKYLNRGPSWHVSKLPEYWVERAFLEVPEEDDAHWKEVEWVLRLLVDGMRTPHDMKMYRSRNIFERVLTLTSSPSASKTVKELCLQLVYRIICADGESAEGSTTLVTRAGALAWLPMQEHGSRFDKASLRHLTNRIEDRVDAAGLAVWSNGTWNGRSESSRVS